MKLFVLTTPQARSNCAAWIEREAPAGYLVKIVQPEKSRDQERIAHSCYQDFARCAPIDGRPCTAEDWKAKLKADFFDETGSDPEFAAEWHGHKPTLTAIPGTRYVVMSEIHSARFPRKLYRAFITFLHARGDDLGVQWSATSLGREFA